MLFIILFVLLALSVTAWSPTDLDHFWGGIFELIIKEREGRKELREGIKGIKIFH